MCCFDYDDDRTTSAVFMELSLPFIENVETQIAVRYEDYGGNIGSEGFSEDRHELAPG
jgi:hypothetical protein